MRLIKVDLSKIEFEYTDYSKELYDSIMRIGFSFPIHVLKYDEHYVCTDGHKRLSVLSDILKENPDYKRGRDVCIVLDVRSDDCWRGRNTH